MSRDSVFQFWYSISYFCCLHTFYIASALAFTDNGQYFAAKSGQDDIMLHVFLMTALRQTEWF